MFEYHGQPYEKVSIEQSDWAGMKGTEQAGEFNCLPKVTVNVSGQSCQMAQLGATLRFFGMKYGYYSSNDWQL